MPELPTVSLVSLVSLVSRVPLAHRHRSAPAPAPGRRGRPGRRDRGTEPLGWARGLEERGAGAYRVVVEPTMGRAVRRAVAATRETGRPVGLLVWRGAHSWVLHGFSTSADPALTDDYAITGLWVTDPWYPRVSSIWGPSRKPNQRITVKQLREDYLKWRRPTGRYSGMDGQYVLVLPVADAT